VIHLVAERFDGRYGLLPIVGDLLEWERDDVLGHRLDALRVGPHGIGVTDVHELCRRAADEDVDLHTHPDEFIADWDDAMDSELGAVIASQDAVILGHSSYDEWSRFRPTSTIEPFATFINGVEKHIATSAPLDGQ
jgi:hypothetical protein